MLMRSIYTRGRCQAAGTVILLASGRAGRQADGQAGRPSCARQCKSCAAISFDKVSVRDICREAGVHSFPPPFQVQGRDCCCAALLRWIPIWRSGWRSTALSLPASLPGTAAFMEYGLAVGALQRLNRPDSRSIDSLALRSGPLRECLEAERAPGRICCRVGGRLLSVIRRGGSFTGFCTREAIHYTPSWSRTIL